MSNKILTFVLDTVEPEIGPAIETFTKALEDAGHVVKEIRQATDSGEVKLKLPSEVTEVVDDVDAEVTDIEEEIDKLDPAEKAKIAADEAAKGADVTSGNKPNPLGSLPTPASTPDTP